MRKKHGIFSLRNEKCPTSKQLEIQPTFSQGNTFPPRVYRGRVSVKAVFQWCVFFTYVCSIRINERVYVFWALRTYTYVKKRITGKQPLEHLTGDRKIVVSSPTWELRIFLSPVKVTVKEHHHNNLHIRASISYTSSHLIINGAADTSRCIH